MPNSPADDDPKLIDLEQGVPHFKGTPCSVTKLTAGEIKALEAEYGATNALPRGPEGKVLRSDARPNDFMWDDKVGDGIEFEATELSTYGPYTTLRSGYGFNNNAGGIAHGADGSGNRCGQGHWSRNLAATRRARLRLVFARA